MRYCIQYIPASAVQKIYDQNKEDIDKGILSVWDIVTTDDLEKNIIVESKTILMREVKKAFSMDEFGEVLIDKQIQNKKTRSWKTIERATYQGEGKLEFQEYVY